LTWWAITHDDLAALVELAAECYLADGGLGFMNEPDNLSERYFPDTPGAAMGAWAAGGNLVACAAVHLIRESDTERAIIVGQVRPELRDKGIGTYLMHWSQEQALALFAAPPVDKQVLQVATESLTESADRLYQANGFESVFESLVMQRDLRLPVPDKTLPPGVTLTSWQTDLAEQFFQAYQAAFRNWPGFPGWSVTEWIARVLDNDFKPEWSLLARAGEMPLGFVIGTTDLTTDPPGGEVWQIGVIPTQRRRGLASALLVETMRRMQAAGALSAQLTVHINNPGAIQTYIQLGFAMAGRRARYERIPE
jgi:mycothiol synthase